MAAHVSAIEAVPALELVAREGDAIALSEAAVREVLDDPRVNAVAVATRPADREYWVRRAADAGRHVLCELPVVNNAAAATKLRNHCRDLGVALCLASRASPEPERSLRGLATDGDLGALVFVELSIFVPRAWLAVGQQGVVLEYGAPLVSVMQDCLGPIDTITARTRSLVTNRPQEDVAVVQLRFRNGIEGVLQVNGLGTEACVRAAVYGGAGSRAMEAVLRETDAIALQRAYEELAGLATTRPESGPAAGLPSSATAMVDGLFIVDWIHQSARHDTEVMRRDVRLS